MSGSVAILQQRISDHIEASEERCIAAKLSVPG
jgi:hypothetical protein